MSRAVEPSLFPDLHEEPTSPFDVLLREAFDAGWDSRSGNDWKVNEGYARRKAWAAYRARLSGRSPASMSSSNA